jgi:hypothetical protein
MTTNAGERIADIDACILDVINEHHPPEALGELLKKMSATPEEMALVITIAARRWAGPSYQHIRTMLEAHLSVLLTRAHVRAQEKMSASAGFLAAASVFLAIVSLIGSCSG